MSTTVDSSAGAERALSLALSQDQRDIAGSDVSSMSKLKTGEVAAWATERAIQIP